ncbi:hypothetical protein G5B10_07705 [Fluviicola sp. SGL-29]|nr:hypothetical protein [Fluviicola sp. SGL-29]
MGDLVRRKKVFEHISHAANSIRDIALDEIPGGAIIKTLWNYNSEIQTSRSLKFLGDFQQILEEKLGRNFYDYELQNEDFHDLFYRIMSEVQKTNSQEKLKHFRNVLLNQVIEPPKDNTLTFKYVNLINTLADIQIIILNKMWTDSSGIFSDMRAAIIPYPILQETRENEKIIVDIDGYIKEFTKADLTFYCKELVSVGLVNESLKPTRANGAGGSSKRYSISYSGTDFLNFIKLNG